MKGKLIKILLIGLIIVLTFCPLVKGVENSHTPEYEHVKNLTEIGPRLAGTDGESEAVQYVENELKSYGLSVKISGFQLEDGYIFQSGQLSIQAPFKENLKFTPLIRSPATKEELIENLTIIENIPENTTSLQDDIVLTESKNLSKINKTKPKAIIIFKENKPAWSNVWPSGSLNSPTVTVSDGTAKFLTELADRQEVGNVTIRFDLNAELENLTSHNVVGTLPGRKDEVIIVAAHHDSVLNSGAIDDGTGVAVLLETARELSDENLLRTVKFITFGAEEYGLIGSEEYVKDIEDEKIVGVIDFDSICPGPSNGLRIGVKDFSDKGTARWLDEYVGDVASDIGLDYSYGSFEEAEGYSDYVSFMEKNIPATWIYWVTGREGDPLWMVHTSEDKLEQVSESNLRDVSRLSVSSVRMLSTGGIKGWFWESESSEKVSIFTILSSVLVVVGLAGLGYLRYVQKRKAWVVISETVLLVSIGIIVLYFWLF